MRNVTLMLVVCACTFTVVANAQNNTDALRYSQLTFGGTARGMGLAGAVGSLGADVTDLAVNPAGLGLYRSSEVEITPSLYMLNNTSDYFGTTNTTDKTNFNLTNFGAVFTHKIRPRRSGGASLWKSTSLAIAYNRLNNFNENFYFTGFNPNNSRADSWAQEANSIGDGPYNLYNTDASFDAGLAYQGYLINAGGGGDSTQYSSAIPHGQVQQTEYDQISGSQNEFDISFAANYNDRLYLGLTLGIPTINYNWSSSYSETSNDVPGFQNFTYAQTLNTSGTGINVKFGIIYKITDYLRLGAAIHTPTWYSLQDNYNSYLTSQLDTLGGALNADGAVGNFTVYPPYQYSNGSVYNYNLTTPWRFVGSATLLFKTYGFISADYEYVDYSQASFDFSQSGNPSDIVYQNQVNQTIVSSFQPASIFRIGGEYAYQVFRIRAGFAYYGSPLQSDQIIGSGDQSADNFTGGVGLRFDHVFVDAAYVYSITHSSYAPYTVDPGQAPYTETPYAAVKNVSSNILLTVGYKF